MKVCMVLMNTTSLRSDARVRKEAASLAKAGHIVCLVAKQLPNETFGKSLDGFSLRLVRLRTGGRTGAIVTNLIRYIEFNLKVLTRMLGFRADVYHAHDLDTLFPCWLAAKITGARLVYDSHELYTERPIETPWLWRRLERSLIKRVDAVIAANEDRAEIMLKEYGAKELPTVIRNSPVPPSIAETSQYTLREVIPVEFQNKRLLVYQGALSPNRCLENVLRSVQHLDPSAVLVFLGHESSFSNSVLRPLVTELNLIDRIHFAKAVDSRQVVHTLSSADLGVVIYRNSCRNNYLCAPNKLFDYCMAGLPCIACDFPPIRRIGAQFNVLEYFDPEDPCSIASAVNKFIHDPARYTAAKMAALQVARYYTWGREEETLQSLYERLG